MTQIVFDPEGLRAGADRLKSLAAALRSDPAGHASIVADVAAQLRELAGERVSPTQQALAGAADTFESSPNITPESIEDYAARLLEVADNQAATIESVNASFRSL